MVRRLIGFLTADGTDEEIDEFIARAKKMGEDPDRTPPTAFIRQSEPRRAPAKKKHPSPPAGR